MNTLSLATALASLPAAQTAATPAQAPAAPTLVFPKELTLPQRRIYAFAAAQAAASDSERWAWRCKHAEIACELKGWSVDTATFLHNLMPWTAKDSVPAWMRQAEAETAQLYAAFASAARAERMEILAQRITAALERVADKIAPVAEPPAPVAQLPDAVEARFAAVEAASDANAKILAAIAAKVGVKVGVTP